MTKKISVCIPAYNRPEVLPHLLESILSQNYDDFEIVICEDNSPKRKEIREIASDYNLKYPGIIKYYENEKNLGYDGNLRNIITKASGEYCFFMGNDDLVLPGALSKVASAIERYDNIGVLLRSYASFNGSPENIDQIFRYFESERFFPAGAETISTFYRRSVVIPGMTIHREEALKYSTERFDGTLLYQLYLVANILTRMNGVFLPEILVLYRNGGIPDFGNSEPEREKFVPAAHTPESSLHFVRGMLDIAEYVDRTKNVRIYRRIKRDIGNYSYPILSIQAEKPLPVFLKYSYQLAKWGFWKNAMFHLYFLSLLFMGSKRVDRIINLVKTRMGYTPAIGNIYQGEPV
ncbi:MAG: glycosyltransferase family 2 protein [Candidatus Methanoperedens sp.]